MNVFIFTETTCSLQIFFVNSRGQVLQLYLSTCTCLMPFRENVTILEILGSTTAGDLGFPGGGAQPGGDTNILFDQFFPKNCTIMKKCWPRGAHVPCTPPDLPMFIDTQKINENRFIRHCRFFSFQSFLSIVNSSPITTLYLVQWFKRWDQ